VTCADTDAVLYPYVDGELTGGDREAVEAHLVGCSACAGRARLESRFKAAVRAHLARPMVPVALKLRLDRVLAAEPIAPRRWPAWFSYQRLVPAAAAAVLLLAITSTVRQSQSVVLEQARRTYQAEMPMDVTGSDCSSIASWFRGRVDFPVRAPALGGGATCQGGRLVNVGERAAAYLVYRVQDGHRVALLVFDPRDEAFDAPERRVVNGREIYLGGGPGISTATYRDRGLGYVVTSDLDADALTRLVITSFGH
jgi:anti-sigma factor RsiW